MNNFQSAFLAAQVLCLICVIVCGKKMLSTMDGEYPHYTTSNKWQRRMNIAAVTNYVFFVLNISALILSI